MLGCWDYDAAKMSQPGRMFRMRTLTEPYCAEVKGQENTVLTWHCEVVTAKSLAGAASKVEGHVCGCGRLVTAWSHHWCDRHFPRPPLLGSDEPEGSRARDLLYGPRCCCSHPPLPRDPTGTLYEAGRGQGALPSPLPVHCGNPQLQQGHRTAGTPPCALSQVHCPSARFLLLVSSWRCSGGNLSVPGTWGGSLLLFSVWAEAGGHTKSPSRILGLGGLW